MAIMSCTTMDASFSFESSLALRTMKVRLDIVISIGEKLAHPSEIASYCIEIDQPSIGRFMKASNFKCRVCPVQKF